MVKSGKIIIPAPFAIVLAALIIVPFASADEGNLTPATTPFITVDPIGTHTLDEVFFISGTTNLPVSDSPLILQIYSAAFNPGGSGCDYQSNVIIEPGVGGINTWSCNATPDLWQTHGIGPSFKVTPGAAPGEYVVTVASPDPRISAKDSRLISILSPEDIERSTAVSPGLTPPSNFTAARDRAGYGIPDSPALVQNSTQGTAVQTGNPPREVPTTHPAPLPLAVSVTAVGLGAIVIHRSCKS